jgi:hypothetical protein
MKYMNFELVDEKGNEIEGILESDGKELVVRVEGAEVATVEYAKKKVKVVVIKQSGQVEVEGPAEVVTLADPFKV